MVSHLYSPIDRILNINMKKRMKKIKTKLD